jgi:hypothetical protein
MYPPPTTKSRSDVSRTDGKYHWYLQDKLNPSLTINIVNLNRKFTYIRKSEHLSSEDHPKWRAQLGSKNNVGGPFFVERLIMDYPAEFFERKDKSHFGGNYDQVFHLKGVVWPSIESLIVPPPSLASDIYQMDKWGAECVAKAAPGTSPMNLAVSLGELKKDGLPSIVGSTFKRRAGVAKAAGDEYLNLQFGWAPLVKDVKSLAKTVTSADDILHQMERDSGKVVRRRLTLKDESEIISSDIIGDSTPLVGGIRSTYTDHFFPSSKLRLTIQQNRKVWFSGAFTYYLPPDYYSRNAIARGSARANELLGLDLNPSTLWNLAPWSWAADWFSNADEVISNTTRFLTEGLVMHYGYLMEHTQHIYTYTATNGCVPPLTLMTETKGRVKANPFGFGVDWPDLSGFQLSILGALGLSKSRRG